MGFKSQDYKEIIKEIQIKQRQVVLQNGSCGNYKCRKQFVCKLKRKVLRTMNQYCHLWSPQKNVA